MHVEDSNHTPVVSGSVVPDYTLRKKYTKRPAHVIKIRLMEPKKDLKLPEDDIHRMWTMMDNILVVIKTWHYGPLPRVKKIFKRVELENVTIEFNLGPHIEDLEILKEFKELNSRYFSLEFREHWAGLCPTAGSEASLNKNEVVSAVSYSDEFLVPFLCAKTISAKLRVVTGRISIDCIRTLFSCCNNLNFLGLRVNYEEYCELTNLLHLLTSLERIHLLPQWKYDPVLLIPPIKFSGVVTIYYFDLETTQAVNKALKKWKKSQSKRRKYLCWSV